MRCLARALLLAALGASVHANSSSSSSSKSGKGGSGSGGSGSRYIPTPFVKRVGVPVGSGIFDEEVVSEAVGTNAEGTRFLVSVHASSNRTLNNARHTSISPHGCMMPIVCALRINVEA
jgi:hypothetical protein